MRIKYTDTYEVPEGFNQGELLLFLQTDDLTDIISVKFYFVFFLAICIKWYICQQYSFDIFLATDERR